MSVAGRAHAWLRAVGMSGRMDREMREEMNEHLNESVNRLMRRGMSLEMAQREARREFGNVTGIQEDAREAQGLRWLHDAVQDFRLATRRMRKTPALTVAIISTIGLGLGAAAAIYSVSHAALIDSLPYTNPHQLVHLWETRTGLDDRSPTSYRTLLDWRVRARGFTALEGYDASNFTVGIANDARLLRGARVTSGFFRMLGVRIQAGRDFVPDESNENVAIVSEQFARNTLGSNALDRSITINGSSRLVVGVLPATFHFALLQNADVFVPMTVSDQQRPARSDRFMEVVGRLSDTASLRLVRGELSGLMAALASEDPEALVGRAVTVLPLRDALIGNVKPILSSLLIAVGALVVIMAANLLLLMLTRYVERTPELSMRSALGASQARILRQLFIESLVPSVCGTCLALFVAQLATQKLLSAIPDGVRIGMPYLATVGLDGSTIGMMAGMSLVLATAFGIGPALVMTASEGKPGDRRTTLARGDRRFRRGLACLQMALTVVLLVSSGFLVVSFRKLVDRDVGISHPESVIAARAPLSGPQFAKAEAQQRFYESLIERAAAIPGVRGAAAVSEVPGGGGGLTTFEPMDHPRPPAARERAVIRTVAGNYFAMVGIPVISGRTFETRDGPVGQRVAVVSAGLGKLLAADGPTIGRRIRVSDTDSLGWEVVGVAGDVQAAALDAIPPAVIYLSHMQVAENRMMLVLRTNVSVSSVEREVRAIAKSLDSSVPVYAVTTLERQFSESHAVFSRRLPMLLCGVFATGALALTVIALYAICAYEASTRRREFGIRLALGSSPALIRKMIFSDVVLLGVAGITIGEIAAIVVSHVMQAVLFGISAMDPRIYIAAGLVVLMCTCLASLGPALRAGAQNPAVVMHAE